MNGPVQRLPMARPVATAARPTAARRSAGSSTKAKPPPSVDTDAVTDATVRSMTDVELQLALAAQSQKFDNMMRILAEQQREINAIVDLGMAQTKRSDQLMNEWIRLI